MTEATTHTGTTMHHWCLSVRGVLLNNDRTLRQDHMKWIKQDDGTPFPTPTALRMALMDELAKGREVLPISECDNFDYKRGCGGHPQ